MLIALKKLSTELDISRHYTLIYLVLDTTRPDPDIFFTGQLMCSISNRSVLKIPKALKACGSLKIFPKSAPGHISRFIEPIE